MKKYLSLFILYYLRLLAKIQLAKNKPIIIGVTGSAGKTSTVAAIETILKKKYAVKTTDGANSETGIPLSILNLKMIDYSPLDWLRVILLAPIRCLLAAEHYDFLVAEMGIDSLYWPKNMDYLLTIVHPKIGVFLNALPVHTEQMKSIGNIASEKSKLITSLPKDGYAIINKNDLRTHVATAAKTIYFDGTSLGAANTIGKLFNLSPIKEFPIPNGRGRFFAGINDSLLVDSSYNASPTTVLSVLNALSNKKTPGRTIAVLGDMRELGDLAPKFHREIAAAAYKLADIVLTVGPLTKKYFPKNPKLIAQFDNSHEAGDYLQTHIKPGDLVLFKGSQNTIFLETAVEMCLANKSDAEKLCRRGKFWEKQRKKFHTIDDR